MNTLEELIYYCQEPEPVGALLLTGEWGCGKTYLIDHELKDKLKEEAFVLRISLFGLSSLEEIHIAVKQAWMNVYFQNKWIKGTVIEKAQKGAELIPKLEFLPDWLKGIASTDWTSFVKIEKRIEDKSVILVFDDLERCQIDCVDVLGTINDYCENQKFHTIIVANQDKIHILPEATHIDAEIEFNGNEKNSGTLLEKKQAILNIKVPPKTDSKSISYTEIKEKIIQRTIKYIPDYPAIVHTVIEKMKYEQSDQGEKYKTFIGECEKGLLELFAPEKDWLEKNEKKSNGKNEQTAFKKDVVQYHERPHNIRSLK